jgi:hypothetical protein
MGHSTLRRYRAGRRRGALTELQSTLIGAARYRGPSSGSTTFFTGLSNKVAGIRAEEGRVRDAYVFAFAFSLCVRNGGDS